MVEQITDISKNIAKIYRVGRSVFSRSSCLLTFLLLNNNYRFISLY